MTTLWLVGVMGAGKTTAGRMAASVLGVPFWDTDEMVESDAGASIAEIWAKDGEDAFRDLESSVVARLSGEEGIVATGGGAVLDPANREAALELIGDLEQWLEGAGFRDIDISVVAREEEAPHFQTLLAEGRK